jgi:hypothetical protein
MTRTMSILAVSALVLTLQPAAATADDAVEDCHTTILSSTMSPTRIVVGVGAPRSSTFTVELDNNCDNPTVEVNLAGAVFPVGMHVSMDAGTPHGNNRYTFSGTTIWGAADLMDERAAGSWISYIDATSDNGPFVSAPGVSFSLLHASSIAVAPSLAAVKKGDHVTVSGSLKRADWSSAAYDSYGGQRVQLQRKLPGGEYATIKTSRSMRNGAIFNIVSADQDGCYRMLFRGNATTGPTAGPGQCVLVD